MRVNISGISKTFGKQQVLKGIDLEIQDDEIFGLIGPSGAGKTTLIRLILGAIEPDAGHISVGDIKIPSFAALARIGYMPQSESLYGDLSGLDNLLFFGSMYGMKNSTLKERAAGVLKLVELDNDGKKLVNNYSGGMKKRLSLAAALLAEPGLLILDEPTVGIDPLLRKKIWAQFRALKAQGKTIIITTHVMDEAAMCDRCALIYNGSVIACDQFDVLLSRTANHSIEEIFIENGVENA
ncbi:MAG: ABC transporter ATP-binding protein [Bacillota bacterium]|nr:ABC transporter ATP-binding protein [Bacillota bacterium]